MLRNAETSGALEAITVPQGTAFSEALSSLLVREALLSEFIHAARMSTIGEMASTIAHEVSQPLSVIVSDADTSRRILARDKPDLRMVDRLITRISESAERATDIVTRVRAMAANRPPIKADVDVREVVSASIGFVSPEAASRRISIRSEIAGGDVLVSGDVIQLQQILVNFLMNAIQAIDHSAAKLREVEIVVTGSHDLVAISVRDTGPGIRHDQAARIFDNFFSTKDGGMGMGLAICKSIAEAHGGHIEAVNWANGAVFSFSLPRVKTRPSTTV